MKRIIAQAMFVALLLNSAHFIHSQDQTLAVVKNSLRAAGLGSFIYGLFNAGHFEEEIRKYLKDRSEADEALQQMNMLRDLKVLASRCNNVDEFIQRARLTDTEAALAIGANWGGWIVSKVTNKTVWETTQQFIYTTLDAQVDLQNSQREEALRRANFSTRFKCVAAGLLAGFVGLCMGAHQDSKNSAE